MCDDTANASYFIFVMLFDIAGVSAETEYSLCMVQCSFADSCNCGKFNVVYSGMHRKYCNCEKKNIERIILCVEFLLHHFRVRALKSFESLTRNQMVHKKQSKFSCAHNQ